MTKWGTVSLLIVSGAAVSSLGWLTSKDELKQLGSDLIIKASKYEENKSQAS
jgi:hypothetical protein